MARRTIDERLNRARVALDNAQSDESLKQPLAAFGYDEARLQDGQDLLDAAESAQETHAAEYGDQYAATDALKATREDAHDTYVRHLKVARVAFKDDANARQALVLGGRREESLSGWLRQAQTFYSNALGDADLEAGLAQFNIMPEDLQAAQAKVEEVEAADAAQEKEKGEAQQATERRDAAMDALHAYMSDFRDIARVVFEDDRQQLEKLQIIAPSA